MGTGKVAKKRSTKAKNPEAAAFNEQLATTGTFILREFCEEHGMDHSVAMKTAKSDLISFLKGKFKDGEIKFNDLWPDDDEEKPKKSSKKGSKKSSSKKSKAKDDDDDAGFDDDDDDNAGDDDLDDDDIDVEIDDDDDVGFDDDDDDDGGDDDDMDVDVDEDDDDSGGGDTDGDISILENKVDKLLDINTKAAKTLDNIAQVQLEMREMVLQGLKVVFKLLKVKNPKKLLGQIEKKAAKAAGIEDLEDE